MSYNGIGLPTARGTGTSGHIQKSKSSNAYNYAVNYEWRQQQERERRRDTQKFATTNVSDRKVDKEILQHERDREIEVKCMELEVELEDEGVDPDEIEKRVDALRSELMKSPPTSRQPQINKKGHTRQFKEYQVHDLAAAKEEANERFKQAVGGHSYRRRRRERSLSPVTSARDGEKRHAERRSDDEGRFGDRYRPSRRGAPRDRTDSRDDRHYRDDRRNRDEKSSDERRDEASGDEKRYRNEPTGGEGGRRRNRSNSPPKDAPEIKRTLKPY
ncbi:hypothetical protein TRVA0_045S00694 [Trichomonascus vanleenenianus]|uniref:U2-type spliceosomal complex subunit CWC21 n=1 Tax=Trichomonascus vanleenenianus TaxID=2268995 RepID=UPI003EC9EDCA